MILLNLIYIFYRSKSCFKKYLCFIFVNFWDEFHKKILHLEFIVILTQFNILRINFSHIDAILLVKQSVRYNSFQSYFAFKYSLFYYYFDSMNPLEEMKITFEKIKYSYNFNLLFKINFRWSVNWDINLTKYWHYKVMVNVISTVHYL